MQALSRARGPLAAPRAALPAPRRAARAALPGRRRACAPRAALASPPSAAESAAEAALSAATGDIVGIPRAEWLRLQAPARYLGNEWGAVHKPWADATIRFALAYPEVRALPRRTAARHRSRRTLMPRPDPAALRCARCMRLAHPTWGTSCCTPC
jgi:hypothetical protein